MKMEKFCGVESLRRLEWFQELEQRVLDVWNRGEGDITIEFRNSKNDGRGNDIRTTKIQSSTRYRWEEGDKKQT